jgi:hypothetical protein
MDDGVLVKHCYAVSMKGSEVAYLSLAKLQKMQLELGNSLFIILGHEHKESSAKNDQWNEKKGVQIPLDGTRD